MTDPTPIRAEVEAAVEKLANSHLGMSLEEWNAVSNTILACAAENQALRERAEAAERHKDAGWDQQRYWSDRYVTKTTALEKALVGARRAEAAAWNDAIEAAAKVGDHYADMDYCAMGYPEDGGIAASGTADTIRQAIRALRRAAPTEGEA